MKLLLSMMDGMITGHRGREGHPGLVMTAAGQIADKRSDNTVVGRVMNQWSALLVERGRGTFFSRPSRRHEVGAGTLLLLFPGVAHWYRPDPTWTESWLLFEGPMVQAAQDQNFIAPARAVIRADARCRDAFQRSWRSWFDGGRINRALAAASLYECLIASAACATPTGKDESDDPVRAAEAWLAGNPDISPGRIAKEIGIPYPTLRRRFLAATGRSMRDYGIDIRLRQAQALLTETDRPVAAIAADCGFDDVFYFSRLFRSRLGANPTAFRRLLPQQAGRRTITEKS